MSAATSVVNSVLPGGYVIQRMVARGAFAVVYEARSADGQHVAIKVLDSKHPQAYKRFMREIKVMQALPDSRYRVRYIDHGEMENGTPFLAMEFIVGFTLGRLLRSGRRMTEAAACKLMMQLCEAFGGLHKLGMTHGDIKPDNIMLAKGEPAPRTKKRGFRGSENLVHLGQVERSGLRMKLLDFGLVRDAQGLLKLLEEEAVLPGDDFQEYLEGGMIAGTPEYIAPEQITDARVTTREDTRTDTPADVFGLGVIFYELLTGKPSWPFRLQGSDPRFYRQQAKAYMDARSVGQPIPDAPPGTSQALWSVISKAMHPDPKMRQGDARQLFRDVERYVEYGAGVPGDLDTEVTIMAYLDDLNMPEGLPGIPKTPTPVFEVSGETSVMAPRPRRMSLWVAVAAATLAALVFVVAKLT